MNIRINDFEVLSHKVRLEVVKNYCAQFESIKEGRTTLNLPWNEYSIKETGKNPVKIKYGTNNYWVLCKKTKSSYIFTVRFA